MDSITFKIYSKMFPGTGGTLPAFACIETSGVLVKKDTESLLNNLIAKQAIDIEKIEINAFLKLFKKMSYTIANKFISDAINYYFSHPQVLTTIQDGKSTLFPNYRSLPDIDYDLLIPVFEKGCHNE